MAGIDTVVHIAARVHVMNDATSDPLAPVDPYAISKAEAEHGLLKLAEEIGLEVVIIRPPLVYGPGVKANFRLPWIAGLLF